MSANSESLLSEPKIALALSGGGARAMAFHLGCLRALHDLGILDRVRVLSTVSGGSVIGALYATSDDPFHVFEAHVRTVLARGLAKPAVRTALLTTEGLKAVLCFALVGTANLLFAILTWVLWLAALVLPTGWLEVRQAENWHLPFRRFASRTTILRRTWTMSCSRENA
jgi:NTE family protein